MQRIAFCIAFALLALCLAGCSQGPERPGPNPTGGPSSPTSSGSDTSSGPPTTNEPPAFFPRHLALNDCSGGGFIVQGFEALYPGKVPPGWESTDGTVDLFYRLYECNRFSLDRFERGPVRMLFELHTHGEFPLSCQQGDFDLMRNMESWWVDDPELAEYGQTTYGLPIHYVEFNRATSTDPSGFEHETWTWPAPNGGEESNVEFVDGVHHEDEGLVERIFWFNATGLFSMDFKWHDEFNAAGSYLPARLQPPLIYSNNTGIADFVPRALIVKNYEGQGDIQAYGDYQCEKPL